MDFAITGYTGAIIGFIMAATTLWVILVGVFYIVTTTLYQLLKRSLGLLGVWLLFFFM
jgi:hypothetical protein